VDFDQNGEINYSEFVSCTLDRTLLSTQNLLKVFSYLLDSSSCPVHSTTSTGSTLTYSSLKSAFQRRGDFNLERFNQMMSEIGIS